MATCVLLCVWSTCSARGTTWWNRPVRTNRSFRASRTTW